jgi:Mce-associated membrane protein
LCHDTPRRDLVRKEDAVTADTEIVAEGQDTPVPEPGLGDEVDASADADGGARPHRRRWRNVLVYGVLPVLALLLASTAGYLKWVGDTASDGPTAASAPVRAATDGTTAILSYRPDTAEKDLGAASDRLTGAFKDSYTALIHDVVIPAAKQKQVSAVAAVPAAAAVSASEKHAVVLVFVN